MSRSKEVQQSVGGTTRREALKMAGVAAIGGVAATFASESSVGAVLRSAATSGRRFSLEIDGVIVGGVHEIDPVSSVSDVTYTVDPATGAVSSKPGALTEQSVKMVKDWSNTAEWYNWRKTVVDGKVDRKSISIVILSDSGQEAGRILLFNCWPSAYEGPTLSAKNSGRASEKLTISWETCEMKAG